jgi:hypothetical protein
MFKILYFTQTGIYTNNAFPFTTQLSINDILGTRR